MGKGLLGTNHVIVSPDGGHAYVTGSLDNAVSWYSINSGRLSFLGYLKDGENGVDGLSSVISYYLMTVFLLIFRLPRQSDQLV